MKGAGFFPHTSQSGSAFKGRGRADAAEEGTEAEEEAEVEATAEAAAEATAEAAAGAADVEVGWVEARRLEGGVEDEGENPSVDGDGLLEAPAFFPPLFFGMVVVCGVVSN